MSKDENEDDSYEKDMENSIYNPLCTVFLFEATDSKYALNETSIINILQARANIIGTSAETILTSSSAATIFFILAIGNSECCLKSPDLLSSISFKITLSHIILTLLLIDDTNSVEEEEDDDEDDDAEDEDS